MARSLSLPALFRAPEYSRGKVSLESPILALLVMEKLSTLSPNLSTKNSLRARTLFSSDLVGQSASRPDLLLQERIAILADQNIPLLPRNALPRTHQDRRKTNSRPPTQETRRHRLLNTDILNVSRLIDATHFRFRILNRFRTIGPTPPQKLRTQLPIGDLKD